MLLSRTVPVGVASLAALLLVGCGTAALRSVSSGEIGCPPDAITISNDRQPYGTGTRTWTAECNGEIYYCSAAAIGDGGTAGCAPAQGGSEAAAPASTPATAAPAPVQSTESETVPENKPLYSTLAPEEEFPSKAAGFVFGASLGETKTACESASHEWEDTAKASKCSGLIEDIGVRAKAQVRFCGDKLCRLGAAIVVDESDPKVPLAIWGSLNKKYGRPAVNKTKVPRSCSKSMYECIESGEAVMDAKWRWNDDSTIAARFEKKRGGVYLMLYYSLVMEDVPDQGQGAEPEKDYGGSF